MNDRQAVARLATVLLLTLPIVDMLRDGTVDGALVGALLILAAGGGVGHVADTVLKASAERRSTPDQGGDDA